MLLVSGVNVTTFLSFTCSFTSFQSFSGGGGGGGGGGSEYSLCFLEWNFLV